MRNLTKQLWRIFRHPQPYRTTIAQRLWKRSHPEPKYPYYEYCVREGARLAKALGQEGATVVEFGVAGGNGLVALEGYAEKVEQELGITIDVAGFDSGAGMPAPRDYRDMPYKWGAGYYPMDEEALRRRVKRAELVLGPVEETTREFAARCRYPIAAVMMDLDYYSSTVEAFQLFDLAPALPRVPIYFDDLWLATPFTGEWAAIEHFNETHPTRKITQTWALAHATDWSVRIFELHAFDHPDYSRRLTTVEQHGQLPLTS